MKDLRTLTAAAGVLLLQSLLIASPQWLQYRTSDRARDIIGGSSQFMRIAADLSEKPALPEASEGQPLYFQWKTGMDSAGIRLIALDRSHQYGLCDIVYIDSDGDGKLDDEQQYKGRQTSQYQVEFGQVPIYFEGEDGPITYHLNLRFYSYNEQSTYLYAYAGCWYEGQVVIDGKETRCVLVDYNCNGAFNDKSEGFNCDRILTGPEQQAHQGYVGNYLELDKTLYHLNIAKDGAFVELTPAPEVEYAAVTMPKSITAFAAGGMNGMFQRTVENGKVSLPLGKYRVYSWEIARQDDKGTEWKLQGDGFPQNKDFTVEKDAFVMLDVGEPVYSKLDVSLRDGGHYFNQGLVGKSGEDINITKAGRRIEAPKIHIRNGTGQYDRTFTLEYG